MACRMRELNKENWEQIRARGHTRFIVRRGLLWWGVPFGLIVTLGPFLYDLLTDAPTQPLWRLIGSFALLTLVFGYGMGETEWRRGERDYNALVGKSRP